MTDYKLANDSILSRIASDDRQAVEECINKYGNLVWSITLNYLCSRAEAEDVVQDIFIDVWKHAGRFDPQKSGEANFIAMIARRRLIDSLRKSNRRPQTQFLDDITGKFSNDADKKLQNYIEFKDIFQKLNCLKLQQRQVIQMSVCDGMSQTEIAETTGLPVGTVKSLIRRGFQKLRTIISAETENTTVQSYL